MPERMAGVRLPLEMFAVENIVKRRTFYSRKSFRNGALGIAGKPGWTAIDCGTVDIRVETNLFSTLAA